MKKYLIYLLVLLINFNSNMSKVYSQMKKPVYGETCELNEFELNMTIEQINKEIAKLERKRQLMDNDRWKLNRLKDMQNFQFNHMVVNNENIKTINDLPPFKMRLSKESQIAGIYEKVDEISGEKENIFDASLYTYSKNTEIEIYAVNMYNKFAQFRKKYKDKIDHIKLNEIEKTYKARYSKYHKNYIISPKDEKILTIQKGIGGNCYLKEWTDKYTLLFFKQLYEQVKISD